MRKTYKLEIEVTLDEADEQRAIAVARRVCGESGGASRAVGEDLWEDISPEEAVSSPVEAVLELVQSNSSLLEAGFEIQGISCGEPEAAPPDVTELSYDAGGAEELFPPEAATPEGSQETDLDEFETGLYLCRWPNGEFSIVKADSRREALFELDEWAAGHASYLTPMDTCMIDFRLDDLGGIELNQLGEETRNTVWETCYPELDELLASDRVQMDDSGQYTAQAKELIQKAVEHERGRLLDSQPEDPEAETEAGKEIQKTLGAAGPVADYYVRQQAQRILKSKAGERGKPN